MKSKRKTEEPQTLETREIPKESQKAKVMTHIHCPGWAAPVRGFYQLRHTSVVTGVCGITRGDLKHALLAFLLSRWGSSTWTAAWASWLKSWRWSVRRRLQGGPSSSQPEKLWASGCSKRRACQRQVRQICCNWSKLNLPHWREEQQIVSQNRHGSVLGCSGLISSGLLRTHWFCFWFLKDSLVLVCCRLVGSRLLWTLQFWFWFGTDSSVLVLGWSGLTGSGSGFFWTHLYPSFTLWLDKCPFCV